jgi:hypothetical protein
VCFGSWIVLKTHLITDDGLLDSSEVLEGRKENVTPLRAANILGEAAELLAQGNKDLVLILDGFCSISN